MLNEQAKQEIMAAFRLNKEECEIKSATNGTLYTIKPKKDNENGNKKLPIKEIKNSMVFNHYNISFNNCVFECEIFLTYKTFKKSLNFDRCIFKKFVNFNGTIFEKISFKNTIFEDIVYFIRIKIKQTSFLRSRFKERAFFSKSVFEQKIDFKEVIFEHNAYFDETTFNGKANFKQSEFYVNVHFYQTKFKNDREKSEREEPNFKQAIFNGYINLTDTKIFDFNFEQLKSETQTSSDAKGFRNIFKNIKNALIKDSNLIDASHFHKMELYAKELEISYKQEKSAKDWIEQIQLYCYRLTSDHHTNLLMILNNVIFLIALFGLANLMLIPLNETNTLLFFKINVIEFIVCLIFMSMAIYFIFDIWKISILKPMHLFLAFLFLAVVFILYIVLMSVTFSLCFAILLSIVLLLLLLTYFLTTKKNLDFKQGIFALSYLIAVFMLFSNPSSILPILGKLIENKSGEVCLFVVGNVKLLCCGGTSYSQTLNLIYMLFLFLLLWSLQKTARKNTIVPS